MTTRTALALALAGVAVPALAQMDAPAPGWGVSIGAMHRNLQEYTPAGGRFVEEDGTLLRLGLAREFSTGGASTLRVEGAVAAGDLDYEAPTANLRSRTGHRDLSLGLAWRPLGETRWGAPGVLLQVLQQRRVIASVGNAIGPRETSTLWMAGLGWSKRLHAGGWQWTPAVEARTSVRHRYEGEFHGVFDNAGFDGGRRNDLRLALAAGPQGSPWSVEAHWTRTRQSSSDTYPLSNAGVVAGTIRHPRITMSDFGIDLRRSF